MKCDLWIEEFYNKIGNQRAEMTTKSKRSTCTTPRCQVYLRKYIIDLQGHWNWSSHKLNKIGKTQKQTFGNLSYDISQVISSNGDNNIKVLEKEPPWLYQRTRQCLPQPSSKIWHGLLQTCMSVLWRKTSSLWASNQHSLLNSKQMNCLSLHIMWVNAKASASFAPRQYQTHSTELHCLDHELIQRGNNKSIRKNFNDGTSICGSQLGASHME